MVVRHAWEASTGEGAVAEADPITENRFARESGDEESEEEEPLESAHPPPEPGDGGSEPAKWEREGKRPPVHTLWEAFCGWTFDRTAGIPKSQRFTFGQKIGFIVE